MSLHFNTGGFGIIKGHEGQKTLNKEHLCFCKYFNNLQSQSCSQYMKKQSQQSVQSQPKRNIIL